MVSGAHVAGPRSPGHCQHPPSETDHWEPGWAVPRAEQPIAPGVHGAALLEQGINCGTSAMTRCPSSSPSLRVWVGARTWGARMAIQPAVAWNSLPSPGAGLAEQPRGQICLDCWHLPTHWAQQLLPCAGGSEAWLHQFRALPPQCSQAVGDLERPPSDRSPQAPKEASCAWSALEPLTSPLSKGGWQEELQSLVSCERR